jgi:hypothetical protein
MDALRKDKAPIVPACVSCEAIHLGCLDAVEM